MIAPIRHEFNITYTIRVATLILSGGIFGTIWNYNFSQFDMSRRNLETNMEHIPEDLETELFL